MRSTIAARGQTVVPAPIRERFGLGPSLEVLLRGVCQPRRCLDDVENFILFSDSRAG